MFVADAGLEKLIGGKCGVVGSFEYGDCRRCYGKRRNTHGNQIFARCPACHLIDDNILYRLSNDHAAIFLLGILKTDYAK